MDPRSGKIKIKAPAKVNLFFEILGRRPDGYHEIRSLMQPIRLFDTLRIEPCLNGPKIQCPNHPDLENESNLALRALYLLEREFNRSLPYSIQLLKRIPIGAGLGGGSSDAAAVLNGCNQLLGYPIPAERLAELGAQLGSDVPFFLYGQTALASGRGERIEPWPAFPSLWFVLIYPGVSVSTSWAYGQVKFPLTIRKKSINIERLKSNHDFLKETRLVNDLEEFVSPSFPVIEKIKKALIEQRCLQALMSGSGSAVFGIWETRKSAQEAFSRLKQQGWENMFLVKGL